MTASTLEEAPVAIAAASTAPAGGGRSLSSGYRSACFSSISPPIVSLSAAINGCFGRCPRRMTILPPGAAGVCEFEAEHRFFAVEIDDRLAADVGLGGGRSFAPHFGAHDPLVRRLAAIAAAPPSGAPKRLRLIADRVRCDGKPRRRRRRSSVPRTS